MRNHSSTPANRALLAALGDMAAQDDAANGRFPPFANIQDCDAALKNCGLDGILPSAGVSDYDQPIDDQLRQVIAILDVLQMFVAGLAATQLIRNHQEPGPKRQCAVSLLGGIATDLGSISLLIEKGFDVQARTLVRTFGELVDLLVATQIDRAFASMFVEESDIDAANEFWRRQVARGRIVTRVSERIKRLSPTGQTPIDEDWRRRRKEMFKWLSTATHASYLAGWFAMIPGLGDDQDRDDRSPELGLFGQPGPVSISTGRAVFSRLFELLFLVRLRRSFFFENDAEEVSDTVYNANKFLWQAIAECYFMKNFKLLEINLNRRGYRLVRTSAN